MAKTNKTRYALLGVLKLAPGSGYDIKKFCDVSISHFWNENYGHIYPVLRQLEEEGLVKAATGQTEKRPPKTVYSITEAGERELRQWLLQPVEDDPTRVELLLKMFFAADLPVENLIGKVQEEKTKHETVIKDLEKVVAILQSGEPKSREIQLWLASVGYGLRNSQARIQWCDETLAVLQSMQQPSASDNDGEE